MKKILSLLTIASFVSIIAFGQEKEQKIEQLETLEYDTVTASVPDTVFIQQQDSVAVKDNTDDETSFKLGNKEIIIKDEDINTDDESFSDEESGKWENVGGARSFKGHLGGIELGLNSYSSSKFGTSIDETDNNYDLNTAKSTSFNIYLPNLDLGFCRRIGIVTTLGFNFNNYRFDNNGTITKNSSTGITEWEPNTSGYDYEKSKLATIYATVPVILEAQIPLSNGHPLNFGVGVIGGIKLGSHTKVVYEHNGRQKDKVHDDFNLNLLRYGVTARAGYKMMQFYGTYYLSPLFETGKGPQLYPFEVGLALTFKD
jgi:hypothetical protein